MNSGALMRPKIIIACSVTSHHPSIPNHTAVWVEGKIRISSHSYRKWMHWSGDQRTIKMQDNQDDLWFWIYEATKTSKSRLGCADELSSK